MDHIVFFNINIENSSKFKEIRFSYQRAHNVSFVSSFHQLNTLSLKGGFLLFYFTKSVDEIHRIELINIQKTFQKCHICLCAKSDFALIAWKIRVNSFLEFPISVNRLISVYQRYISAYSDTPTELTLKTNEGIIKIPYRNINYIKASGNYSFIYLEDDTKIMQTKQLGKYVCIIEHSEYFHRVHRSLILNLDRVKAIKNNTLVFHNSLNKLQVSKSLAARIKSSLLRE